MAKTTLSLTKKETLKEFNKFKIKLNAYFGKELINDDVIIYMIKKFNFTQTELKQVIE